MKEFLTTAFLFCILFTLGCSGSQVCKTDNELLCDLYQTGVTEGSTKRLVFEGSESNYGPIRGSVSMPRAGRICLEIS